MFKSARIKLTGFYLVIILLVSGIFSGVFYHSATREINRIITRLEFEQSLRGDLFFRPGMGPRNPPSIEELLDYKRRIVRALVVVNGLILITAGGGGWFLAGKTLYPIKQMVDDQNQFISDASHELRTPIATLQAEMETKLMEKKITDRQARSLIRSNLEELAALKRLADSLLRLSRIESKNGRFRTVNLSEIVSQAVKKITPLAKKRKMKIEARLLKASIKGDEEAIKEMMIILLDNAVKYGRKRTTVRISGHKKTNSVVVSVADRGIGIAPADLPFVFDRFYRADKSRSETEGFGLGLAIAKKIVIAHGGAIEVTSKPGKGSEFFVKLPLA